MWLGQNGLTNDLNQVSNTTNQVKANTRIYGGSNEASLAEAILQNVNNARSTLEPGAWGTFSGVINYKNENGIGLTGYIDYWVNDGGTGVGTVIPFAGTDTSCVRFNTHGGASTEIIPFSSGNNTKVYSGFTINDILNVSGNVLKENITGGIRISTTCPSTTYTRWDSTARLNIPIDVSKSNTLRIIGNGSGEVYLVNSSGTKVATLSSDYGFVCDVSSLSGDVYIQCNTYYHRRDTHTSTEVRIINVLTF